MIPQLVEAPSSSLAAPVSNTKLPVAIGASDGFPHLPSEPKSGDGAGGGGGGLADEDTLQARLDALRRG